jgi:hypothetical protein
MPECRCFHRHTLSDPFILPIIRTHHQDQVVASRIVKVKQVGDQVQKSQAAGEHDKLILLA